jgi:hypothetical protein
MKDGMGLPTKLVNFIPFLPPSFLTVFINAYLMRRGRLGHFTVHRQVCIRNESTQALASYTLELRRQYLPLPLASLIIIVHTV